MEIAPTNLASAIGPAAAGPEVGAPKAGFTQALDSAEGRSGAPPGVPVPPGRTAPGEGVETQGPIAPSQKPDFHPANDQEAQPAVPAASAAALAATAGSLALQFIPPPPPLLLVENGGGPGSGATLPPPAPLPPITSQPGIALPGGIETPVRAGAPDVPQASPTPTAQRGLVDLAFLEKTEDVVSVKTFNDAPGKAASRSVAPSLMLDPSDVASPPPPAPGQGEPKQPVSAAPAAEAAEALLPTPGTQAAKPGKPDAVDPTPHAGANGATPVAEKSESSAGGQPDTSRQPADRPAAKAATVKTTEPTTVAPAAVQPAASASTRAADRLPLTDAQKTDVIRQVVDRAEILAASKPRDGVAIHLEPKELGAITLFVKSVGNQVDARILASDDHVRAALDQGRAQLGHAMEARGLSLNAIDIGFQTTGSTYAQSHHNATRQQTPQQQASGSAASPTRDEAMPMPTLDAIRKSVRKADGVDLWT